MRDLGKTILDAVWSHIDWKLRQRELAQGLSEELAHTAKTERKAECEEDGRPSPSSPVDSQRSPV